MLLLLVALAASLAINVVLSRRLTNRHPTAISVSSASLKVGQSVPPIVAKRLGGGVESVSASQYRDGLVVYVFTTGCGWCYRNARNAQRLAESLNGHGFIGLALDEFGLHQYVKQHDLTFPVYSNPSKETKTAYHLGTVPNTIVVGTDGAVKASWVGAYSGEIQSEIEKTFRVHLPGLTSLPLRGPTECVDSDGLLYSQGALLSIRGRLHQCASGDWSAVTD
jgi:peroxiredoxin